MRIVDIEALLELLKEEKKSDDCRGFYYSNVCSIIRLLEGLPVLDLETRKSAEWIACDDSHLNKIGLKWECTNCKTVVSMPTRYCHSCGAVMRG